MAAINCNSNAFHFDFFAVGEAELDRRSGEAAVRVNNGNAAMDTFRDRFIPADRIRYRVKHGQVFFTFEEWAAKLHRVFTRCMGELINKALAVERIIGVRNRTPESGWYMHISNHIFIGEIRYRVGIISEHAGINLVNTVFDKVRINRNCNRLIRLSHVPA